ncbi:MAG TPA: hypothetical protein VF574_08005 [Allosphingosinicella sp.]|jgi:hypothetical protein
MATAQILLVIAVAAMQPGPARPEPKPRIARISEEVALQRLRVAGVTDVRIVRRDSASVVLEGRVEGRRLLMRMDGTTGKVVSANDPARVIVPTGRPMGATVVLPQPIERDRIADPVLMREATRSPR